MDQRERVLGVMERAEKEVLRILAEQATAGDYEGIELSRVVALRLRDLRNEFAAPKRQRSGGHGAANMTRPLRAGGSKTTARMKGKYPRFQVEDGALVKIGWSKKAKREYLQRIPESSYLRVCSALTQFGTDGNGAVLSDQILAAVDSSGEAVPSYQIYGVLGFLRDRGVIRMPSRGEYYVPQDVGAGARAAYNGSETSS